MLGVQLKNVDLICMKIFHRNKSLIKLAVPPSVPVFMTHDDVPFS